MFRVLFIAFCLVAPAWSFWFQQQQQPLDTNYRLLGENSVRRGDNIPIDLVGNGIIKYKLYAVDRRGRYAGSFEHPSNPSFRSPLVFSNLFDFTRKDFISFEYFAPTNYRGIVRIIGNIKTVNGKFRVNKNVRVI